MFPKLLSKPDAKCLLTMSCLAGSACVTAPALADQFDATSVVTKATLYPQGAMVTREARLSVPAGQHEIAFADIPLGSHEPHETQSDLIWNSLQIALDGGAMGPVGYGVTQLGEAEHYRGAEAQAARDRLDRLKDMLRDQTRAIAAIRLEATAAEDALAYLGRVTTGEGATGDTLAATARMIREQSLSARLAAQEATSRAEASERDLADLKEEIRQAEIALSRLVPPDRDRLALTVPVEVSDAGELRVTFTYMAPNASWQPLYTARLDTEENSLSLTRSVLATQDTGELWTDVALSFATEDPTRRSVPTEVSEYVRRVFEPRPIEPVMRSQVRALDAEGSADAMMEAAPSAKLQMTLSGLSQTYSYPAPARLYSGEDAVEFALSTLELMPEIMVRAVPLHEDTGYLMTSFTNDSGELLVPGPVRLIRDGVSLGATDLAVLADGAEAELAFGAVDGIQVKRVLLTRNEGDRGVLTKSNEAETDWRIEVTNLTSRAWPIEVVDRVSVTEQEDLKIDWSANPMPDVEGLDDKRGVLAWHFDLAAGDSRDIRLSENLRWPEGKMLR